MQSVDAVLVQAAADLDAIGARWAVIGGLAVAFRAEPRSAFVFTGTDIVARRARADIAGFGPSAATTSSGMSAARFRTRSA
jgi:hypothetical protein